MRRNTKILNRRELYELVWSTPIVQLAKEFGLSDKGLAKICARHRVPVPPRGYWAKLAAGKKVKQTTFHEVDDPHVDRIEITSSLHHLSASTQEIINTAKEKRAEIRKSRLPAAEAVQTFPVVDTPHRSVAGLIQKLRKARPDEYGGVAILDSGPRTKASFGISVHKDRLERLISVLDRLGKEFSDRGYSISLAEGQLRLEAGQEYLEFHIREKTQRIKHLPTEEELEKYEQQKRKRNRHFGDWDLDFSFGWGKPWPEFDIHYTGKLAFVIDSWADGLRKTWADGKTQTLEGMVDQILVGIEAFFAYEKIRKEEALKRERERQELQRRRELSKLRKERENMRAEYLNSVISDSLEAERIKRWLHMVCESHDTDQPSELNRMIKWTQTRLQEFEERINPLSISERLKDLELFPEVDDLHDPMGDPPDRHTYW